jgi:hypothetical protein
MHANDLREFRSVVLLRDGIHAPLFESVHDRRGEIRVEWRFSPPTVRVPGCECVFILYPLQLLFAWEVPGDEIDRVLIALCLDESIADVQQLRANRPGLVLW